MIRYLTDEGLELLEGNEYMEPVIRTQAAAEIRALRQENERLTQIVKGVEGLCIAGPAMINAMVNGLFAAAREQFTPPVPGTVQESSTESAPAHTPGEAK